MQHDRVSIPQWTPSPRELDDLDLIAKRCFKPPVTGFQDPRTAGDASPVTLVVDGQTAQIASGVGVLELVDPEGVPLARLGIFTTWDAGDHRVGLAGPVTPLGHSEFGPFRRLHLPPEQVHRRRAATDLLAVPVRRALTLDDIATISSAASQAGRGILLLPCVGEGMPDDISGPALVRATLAAAELLERDAEVVGVSLADHGWSGPHGRWGSPNAWLLETVAAAYADQQLNLTPKPVGERPPEVEAIVAQDRPPRDRRGLVVFFTGLSGSGKSTLARALVDAVLERGDRTVTSLDGDVVRHHLSQGLGFTREDRETNILRIGFVAAEVARHGGLAVCSPIAPFESTREQVREMVERAGGGFVLVHVATPLAECERRDRKGLYARARAGEIADFTGISSPYEEPSIALKVDTTNRDIAECLEDIVAALTEQGWLRR
ncbi:MAG: adenylyl-sulfate kinase [Nocardioidaceae bacterium]